LLARSEEEESVGSRAFTALLGLSLLAAMAVAAYAWTQPLETASASASRTMTMPAPAAAREPVQAEPEPSDAPLVSLREAARDANAVKPPGTPHAKPVKRPRTVGKKIVDPRLIEARKQVKITMYSAPWCFICDRARDFLVSREVDLTEHDVDVEPSASKALEQLNPAGSIPTFVIEGETIVGFHPWGLEDAIDRAAQAQFCADNDKGAVCERLASR
jgi:glutaredoxin